MRNTGAFLGRLARAAWLGLILGCPAAASVEILPLGEHELRVAETFVLEIPVSNPDGVPLTFSFEPPSGLPAGGAEIYRMDESRGIFRWTPLASQAGSHVFTFRASGGGASDTETAVLTVVLSDSAPVFIQPGAGGTFDLARDPCIAVHVEVKDDDSLPVDIHISEREPRVEGGLLTPAGKQADWRWCPSPAQIAASDRYVLKLAASDGAHAPVHHDYVIVLRGEVRPDCPGTPPEIASTAPPPPGVLSTSLDYRVDAVVRDDRGLKHPPLLYWTTEAPEDREHPDVTVFRQALFVADGGDAYHASIPNLGLAAGVTRTIHYVVSATDNDDAEGTACDHRTDSPLRSFDVAAGGTERAGYCEPCSASAQCAADACVAAAASFCAADCGSCPAGAECRDVSTREGRVVRRCVPPSLSCAGSGCADDRLEENDTRDTAAAVSPDVAYENLRVCSRDEDWFRIDLPASGTLEVLVEGWDASVVDIDLQVLRADGTVLVTSDGLDASEWASACVAAGRYLVRVYGIGTDAGPYGLLASLAPASCCTDDPHEQNDDFRSATRIGAPGSTTSGTICARDDDWFSFAGEAGRRVAVLLLIEGSGDLDLELYDRDGLRRLAYSAGVAAEERLEADLGATGTYYLRVFGYGGAEGDYLLDYEWIASAGCTGSLGCPAGTVCGDGRCIDDACTPGASTCPTGTFCPETGGAGGPSDCADPCTSSAECRSGYACKIFSAGSGCAQSGSGATGAACGSFRACAGSRICLSWTGGYCARAGCTRNADCPSDAYCVQAGGMLGTCVRDCYWSDDECRLAEGYRCACARDIGGAVQWVCLASGVSAPGC
jgi:hypothetical protein